MAFAGPAVELRGNVLEDPGPVEGQVGTLRKVLAQEWSGPRKLDSVMEPYAMVVVWARYSSGLR